VLERLRHRNKGIVYITEDCFGPAGDWAGRPGWQQIADCVTGVAWAQGRFMGLSEPVVPPFPMSDYGTGCMGAIAALTGLLKRATQGGSWLGRTSLCQYDVFLMSLGLYSEAQQAMIRRVHDGDFFELRHADSVDEVSARALRSIRRAYPELFADGGGDVGGERKGGVTQRARSRGFGGEEICWVRSAVSLEGIRVGFERASRPNGFDAPTWDGWEVERELIDG
jgi:CoA-transferase family III